MSGQYRVTAPVTTYTGAVGELNFVNGRYEGGVPDAALVYLTGAGYKVEKLADARKADKAEAQAKADAEAAAAADAGDPAQAEAEAAAAQAEADRIAAEQAAAEADANKQNGASQ